MTYRIILFFVLINISYQCYSQAGKYGRPSDYKSDEQIAKENDPFHMLGILVAGGIIMYFLHASSEEVGPPK